MCFPAAIGLTAAQSAGATFALGLAQAGLQYQAASQSVRAANKAADRNAKSAADSAAGQYFGVVTRQIQQEDAAAEEIARIEEDSLRAESSAILAGLEAGAGGEALVERPRDFRGAALRYSSAVTRSLDNKRGANANDLQAIGVRATNRVANFRPDYTQPSLFNAGLSIFGSYLDANTKFLAPQDNG